MKNIISYLILAVAIGLVLYRFRDDVGDIRDLFEGVIDFARDSIPGMAVAGFAGLLLLWLVFEAVFLAGPRVYDGQLEVGKPFPFTVQTPGEKWVFTVGPTGNRRKELQYRIMAPGMEQVCFGRDSFKKRRRRFEFTPTVRGQHILLVNYTFAGNYTRLGWLRINQDDEAVLLRKFGHLWPIELGVWSPFYPKQQIPGHTIDWKKIREGIDAG